MFFRVSGEALYKMMPEKVTLFWHNICLYFGIWRMYLCRALWYTIRMTSVFWLWSNAIFWHTLFDTHKLKERASFLTVLIVVWMCLVGFCWKSNDSFCNLRLVEAHHVPPVACNLRVELKPLHWRLFMNKHLIGVYDKHQSKAHHDDREKAWWLTIT